MPDMTIQRIAAVLAGVLASAAAPMGLRALQKRLRFLCRAQSSDFDLLYSLEFLRLRLIIEVLLQDGGEELLQYQLSTGNPFLVIDLDVVRGFAVNMLLQRGTRGMTVRELHEELTKRWSAVVIDEHLYQAVTELAHHLCVRKEMLSSDIESWKFTVCPSFERCDYH